MSKKELNCCKCGKEFKLTERIYTSGDLWQCEDCAIKQMQENDNKDKTISDLEAKLAEKQKEIEVLKIQRDLWGGLYNHKNKDQDKISFAVEQLEKVKERYPRKTTMWSSDKTEDGFEYVSDYIDNQIEELKKGVK